MKLFYLIVGVAAIIVAQHIPYHTEDQIAHTLAVLLGLAGGIGVGQAAARQ